MRGCSILVIPLTLAQMSTAWYSTYTKFLMYFERIEYILTCWTIINMVLFVHLCNGITSPPVLCYNILGTGFSFFLTILFGLFRKSGSILERWIQENLVPMLMTGIRPNLIKRWVYYVFSSLPNIATASFTEIYSQMSGTCWVMASNFTNLSFTSFFAFLSHFAIFQGDK